mmetsp:Transcript_61089/g.149570  ORF Transcript_61089/g.149570 Transcript_61089/m.149570 type:complete len:109 (-) Transcript_61089:1515-1841(-)
MKYVENIARDVELKMGCDIRVCPTHITVAPLHLSNRKKQETKLYNIKTTLPSCGRRKKRRKAYVISPIYLVNTLYGSDGVRVSEGRRLCTTVLRKQVKKKRVYQVVFG